MTEQPARYRLRPDEEIEAVQWTGANADVLRAFCGPDFDTIDPEDRAEDPDQDAQLLSDASHWVGLKPMDWVLKHADCFTVTSDEAFRAAWEPAVVQPPANRAAVLREVIERVSHERFPDGNMAYAAGAEWMVGLLERIADEAQPTQPDEDPARIDRLRPEFTEHSSVESIDVQLKRARAQERRWHLRAEWLISLRADRVAQKARGEWPAAGARQDGARP